MNFIRLGFITLMLSLFSNLIGCKSEAETGPYFSETFSKVIHFDSGDHITYEMPGNMSKAMNFAERYKNESPRTFKVFLNNDNDFKVEQWRASQKIDGALWDYRGTKKQGLAGDVGDLNFQISVDKIESGEDLESFVLASYDEFLNGPKGLNMDVRQSDMGQGQSDEELGDWIINAPKKMDSVLVGGKSFKTFSVAWRGGEFYTYFVTSLNDKKFLTLIFRYSIRANSEKDFSKQETRVLGDIQNILSRVVFE